MEMSQNVTPSPRAKVNNWLNRCSWKKCNVKRSAILARHDFKKAPYTISGFSVPEVADSPRKSVESPELLQKHNIFHIHTNLTEEAAKKSEFEIENITPIVNKTCSVYLSNDIGKDYKIFVKKNGSDVKTESGVSSENQKKKELCSYLQLVNLNATTNKEIATNQNRRSSRVKNNQLLTEKKELERKINGETHPDDSGKPQKSFELLFGDASQLKNDIKERSVLECCIPPYLLEKREDFDDFAFKYFKSEQIPLPKPEKAKKHKRRLFGNPNMQSRIVSKWDTPAKRSESLTRRRIRERFNRMFKKPPKKISTYKHNKNNKKFTTTLLRKRNLRSTENLKNVGIKNVLWEEQQKKKNPFKKLRRKKPAEQENPPLNVILRDHNYTTPTESPSDLPSCHGFNSPDRSEEPRRMVEELCSLINDSIVEKPKLVNKPEIVDPVDVSPQSCDYVALDPEVKPKSLHRNLVQLKARRKRAVTDCDTDESPQWDVEESPVVVRQKVDKRAALSHSIRISSESGAIVQAFYVDFNLIIVQESTVTFWTQSALGNILGTHNMWVPKGKATRLVLDNGCVQKESREMVTSVENSIAYIELWTKEHKSDKREIPVADVFAAIYFCRQRQNGVFKKVLQLENIKSSTEDVRYVVMANSRDIVVSWRMVRGDEKVTMIRCYSLAADYQTVDVIKEVESVDHCVWSLHNIEGSDDLVVGWGENMVTLWNLEFGYVIATVEILENFPLSSPLWVKCDRVILHNSILSIDKNNKSTCRRSYFCM